jgi:hypothetical protein
MDVKELTEKLLQQELGELLLKVRFSGPFEWEDIGADVFLKEKPADLADRSYRIHRKLRDEGFDVLIVYEIPDDSDEEDTTEPWR